MGKLRIKKPTGNKIKSDYIQIVGYEITDEPIGDEISTKLPQELKDKMNDLYELIPINPRKAIKELESLLEIYPNLDKIYNFLSVAYSKINEYEKVDEIVFENYKRNPDYIFAKINYAEICLQKNELDKIPEIFNNKFD